MRPRAVGWSGCGRNILIPIALRAMLAAVGVDLAVELGPIPALVAEIETPRGLVIVK